MARSFYAQESAAASELKQMLKGPPNHLQHLFIQQEILLDQLPPKVMNLFLFGFIGIIILPAFPCIHLGEHYAHKTKLYWWS